MLGKNCGQVVDSKGITTPHKNKSRQGEPLRLFETNPVLADRIAI
jgi:hypothetical protein